MKGFGYFMKNVKVTGFVGFSTVVASSVTGLFADDLESSIKDARSKGYEVEVTNNKHEVSTRDELNRLNEFESKRRASEALKLVSDIKKFEDEKVQVLKEYNDEQYKVNSDYTRKLADYKKEFERVSRERTRLTEEYNKKLRDNLLILENNKKAQDKYKEDYAAYEKKLATYNAEVSKIESDYQKSYENYLKQLSDYNKKLLDASIKYENEYNTVANKNKEAHAKYLEDKARIESENKTLKENYEKEVADIKTANEKAKKEYEERLAKWKEAKIKTENTVKTKDLIDSVLTSKIDELKKKGINVTVGHEEVTEVDGTNGKITEADANKKLKELSAVKIAELDRASNTKSNNDARDKEYNDKVTNTKSELAKIMGIKINYTDGGKVSDINSAKNELDQKLNQAKLAGKLASKLNELNTAIKSYDSGIVDKLKAGGVEAGKAQDLYSKKTVVNTSDLATEYNNLLKKADLSDSDINSFVSKVNAKLDEAKGTITKVINKSNSPSGGTELDDTEYNKKLEEYKVKIREWNEHRNDHFSYLNLALTSDLDDIHNISKGGVTNGSNITLVNTTGNVTFYKPINFFRSDSNVGDYLMHHAHTDSTKFPQVNNLMWGTTGTVDYTRVKLGRGASITFDYKLKSGKDMFDNSRKENRMVTYRVVNGQPVLTNAKTLRLKVTNNGSQVTRDGSTIAYFFNDLIEEAMFAYSTTRDWNNLEGKDSLSDMMYKYIYDYTTEYELLDEQGNVLSVGMKSFDTRKENDVSNSEPTWTIRSALEMRNKISYLWGDKYVDEVVDHNVEIGNSSSNFTHEKPGNWDDLDSSRWVINDTTTHDKMVPAKISIRYQFYEDKDFNYKVEGLRHPKYNPNGSDYNHSDRIGGFRFLSKVDPVRPVPTFNYTRKNTSISTLSEISGNQAIDVPIKTLDSKVVNVNVNPVKVVYKYKEMFTEKEPGKPPVKPVPDEAGVRYKPSPKEPAPDKVPVKVDITEKPPKEPVRPNKPNLPEPPVKPNVSNKIIENPTLELPELPKKPWEPDKSVEPKLPKVVKFTVERNEYVLKEGHSSYSNSLAVKHKLASYANSLTLRKL